MFPYFMVFDKMITLYAVMAAIGIFVAGIFVCRLAKKRGLDDNDAIVLLLFTAIGVFFGGHILYGITQFSEIPSIFSSSSFDEFIQNVVWVFGGQVFYGGLLGGIAAAVITAKSMKLELPMYADMIATAIPLFHSFARVGCFLSGCCYGIESEFGFTAHGNTLVPEINGVNRFPVQLLEAALNLILFFVLYSLYKKSLVNKKLYGKIIYIYLASYSVIRFFDEFLRGDEIRGFVFSLSTSQFISIILFAVASTVLVVSAVKAKKSHE